MGVLRTRKVKVGTIRVILSQLKISLRRHKFPDSNNYDCSTNEILPFVKVNRCDITIHNEVDHRNQNLNKTKLLWKN